MRFGRLLLVAGVHLSNVGALACAEAPPAKGAAGSTDEAKLPGKRERPSRLCSTPDLTPNGATESGYFLHAAQLCGCWGGKLSCIPPHSNRCFFRGKWYPQGQFRTIADRRHQCLGSSWTIADPRVIAEPAGLIYPWVTFPGADVELSPEQLAELIEYADEMKGNRRMTLEIVPHVAHPNSKLEKDVAQRRAERVRSVMLEAGIDPARAVIGEVQVSELNGVRLHFKEGGQVSP